ncbi:hypothetical protein EVA_03401 [gut metagenome]|uniref:Uncharacterized protein n=1 Tax=gut metagenome TaxID=749906 RepID=J9D6V4_9ZZZZ
MIAKGATTRDALGQLAADSTLHKFFQNNPSEFHFPHQGIMAFLGCHRVVAVMSAKTNQPIGNKCYLEIKSCYIAYPNVVHGNVLGKRQAALHHTSVHGHATTEITILQKQVVELTSSGAVQYIERISLHL